MKTLKKSVFLIFTSYLSFSIFSTAVDASRFEPEPRKKIKAKFPTVRYHSFQSVNNLKNNSNFVLKLPGSLKNPRFVAPAKKPENDLASSDCILILSAHPFEQKALFRQLSCMRKKMWKFEGKKIFSNQIAVYFYSYKGYRFAFALTGENFISTVIRLQTLSIKMPNIKAVFFVGIGGSLNDKLLPGDICVPSSWACHSTGYVYNEGEKEGYKPRYPSPYNNNFYCYYPDFTMLGFNSKNSPKYVKSIHCDSTLLKFVYSTRKWLNKHNNLRNVLNNANESVQLHCGRVGVSGTVFVDNATYRIFLQETYRADVVDMESFAVASVCSSEKIPFIIFRGISDLAGENGEEGSNYIDRSGRKLASHNVAWFTKKIIQGLPHSNELKQFLFYSRNPN